MDVFKTFIIVLLAVPCRLFAQLQPPVISYVKPPVYTVNKAIVPLVPTNTGGEIPARVYGQVTTFAGSGVKGMVDGRGRAAQLNQPIGICFDKFSNCLYVADASANAIRKITLDGDVTTVAGGTQGYADGNGRAAKFRYPRAVGTDAMGNIFVGEYPNAFIRKIDLLGNVTTYAGQFEQHSSINGPRQNATFNGPMGMVFDEDNNLIVSDYYGSYIRKINTVTGMVSTLAGNGETIDKDGIGTAAGTAAVHDMAVDKSGDIYTIALSGNIRKIDMKTLQVSTIVRLNLSSSTAPSAIAVTGSGNIYICDYTTYEIKEVSPSGRIKVLAGRRQVQGMDDGIGTAATFNSPYGITVDNNDNLYVADAMNGAIRKITLSGYTIDKELPPGMTFDNITGTISGTPTTAWPLTTYTVEAYNSAGIGEAKIDIEVLEPGPLTFAPIATKTVCDDDFYLRATSQNDITFSSSNTAVATVVNGMVHLVGAGTTTITANDGVDNLSQLLYVSPAFTPVVTIAATLTKIYSGKPVTFTAAAQPSKAVTAYQWYINNIPAGKGDSTFTTTALKDGDVITCETTSSGCVTSATVLSNSIPVTVLPIPSLTVPNTFTPNGDGINDLWHITDLEYLPNSRVTVFNRYGAIVYASTGYAKPWDGTTANKPLPTGTYYYIIEPRFEQLPIYKGSVTILR